MGLCCSKEKTKTGLGYTVYSSETDTHAGVYVKLVYDSETGELVEEYNVR